MHALSGSKVVPVPTGAPTWPPCVTKLAAGKVSSPYCSPPPVTRQACALHTITAMHLVCTVMGVPLMSLPQSLVEAAAATTTVLVNGAISQEIINAHTSCVMDVPLARLNGSSRFVQMRSPAKDPPLPCYAGLLGRRPHESGHRTAVAHGYP